jgi:hypothetical protein
MIGKLFIVRRTDGVTHAVQATDENDVRSIWNHLSESSQGIIDTITPANETQALRYERREARETAVRLFIDTIDGPSYDLWEFLSKFHDTIEEWSDVRIGVVETALSEKVEEWCEDNAEHTHQWIARTLLLFARACNLRNNTGAIGSDTPVIERETVNE